MDRPLHDALPPERGSAVTHSDNAKSGATLNSKKESAESPSSQRDTDSPKPMAVSREIRAVRVSSDRSMRSAGDTNSYPFIQRILMVLEVVVGLVR